jgi:hypothetical protein
LGSALPASFDGTQIGGSQVVSRFAVSNLAQTAQCKPVTIFTGASAVNIPVWAQEKGVAHDWNLIDRGLDFGSSRCTAAMEPQQ